MPRPDIKTYKYVVVLLTIMLIIGGFIKMILMSRPDHSLINDLKRPQLLRATIVANGINGAAVAFGGEYQPTFYRDSRPL